MLTEVKLRRDVHTSHGIIPAGATRQASPSGDGRWLVWMWLPNGGRRGRAALVEARSVAGGARLVEVAERRAAAAAEYRHAREVLAMSNDQAVVYVAKGVGVTLKTLRAWGFNTGSAEWTELEAGEMERKARLKREGKQRRKEAK